MQILYLAFPLTSDGIFGNQFDVKLKEITERKKKLAEVLPDIKGHEWLNELGRWI